MAFPASHCWNLTSCSTARKMDPSHLWPSSTCSQFFGRDRHRDRHRHPIRALLGHPRAQTWQSAWERCTVHGKAAQCMGKVHSARERCAVHGEGAQCIGKGAQCMGKVHNAWERCTVHGKGAQCTAHPTGFHRTHVAAAGISPAAHQAECRMRSFQQSSGFFIFPTISWNCTTGI